MLNRIDTTGLKREPVCRQLAQLFGGTWKYDHVCSWRSKQHPDLEVTKVHTGGYDMNGEAMPGWDYMLYDRFNKTAERIYLKKPGRPWTWDK